MNLKPHFLDYTNAKYFDIEIENFSNIFQGSENWNKNLFYVHATFCTKL